MKRKLILILTFIILSINIFTGCQDKNIKSKGYTKNIQATIPLTYDELLVKTDENISSCDYVIVYDDFLQDINNNYLLKNPNMFKDTIIAYSNGEFLIIKKTENTKINTYKEASDEYFYNLGDSIIISGNFIEYEYKLKYKAKVNENELLDYTQNYQPKIVKVIEADTINIVEGTFKY